MEIIASAERHIDAPSRRVYHYIRNVREHHPRLYQAELALLDRYARDAVPDTLPGVPAGSGVISLV